MKTAVFIVCLVGLAYAYPVSIYRSLWFIKSFFVGKRILEPSIFKIIFWLYKAQLLQWVFAYNNKYVMLLAMQSEMNEQVIYWQIRSEKNKYDAFFNLFKCCLHCIGKVWVFYIKKEG